VTTSRIREARLRPAYADLYPDLKPDVWLPACVLAEFVLERGLYQRRSGSAAKDRLLDESHFEFRGGSPAAADPHRLPERIGDTYPTDSEGR
jgi:hypothetical protein